MRLVVVIAVLAGCGRLHFGAMAADARDGTSGDALDAQPPPFVPTWQSGTRIHARVYRASTGDPIFAGWRDTLLGTDCTAAQSADGTERCMPAHIPANDYYADAGCATPLAFVPTSACGVDKYAFAVDGMVHYHAFAIGAPYAGPVYDSRIGCAPSGLPPGAIYSVGTEAPATTFAPSAYRTVPLGAYQHIYVGFGDGSSNDLGFVVTATDTCQPTGGVASGTTRCRSDSLPTLVPAYGDAGCTNRIYVWDRQATDPPALTMFQIDVPAMCGVSYALYGVSSDVTAALYWTLDQSGCHQATTPASTILYAAAPTTDPEPTGTVAPSPNRGRLGKLMWTTPDGIAMPLATWDQQLGRSCFPFRAADGMFRCLPERAKLVTASPDATCTATAATLGATCYGQEPLDGPSYASCDDGPWIVSELPQVGNAASEIEEASCAPLAVPPGGVYDTSATTSELPATMFAELVESVE